MLARLAFAELASGVAIVVAHEHELDLELSERYGQGRSELHTKRAPATLRGGQEHAHDNKKTSRVDNDSNFDVTNSEPRNGHNTPAVANDEHFLRLRSTW